MTEKKPTVIEFDIPTASRGPDGVISDPASAPMIDAHAERPVTAEEKRIVMLETVLSKYIMVVTEREGIDFIDDEPWSAEEHDVLNSARYRARAMRPR